MGKFVERGGVWVLAQIPMLVTAAVLPMWSGRSALTFGRTDWMDIAGWALIVLGVLIGLLGATSLGRSLTPFPRPRRDSPLRVDGVYAWMRHPIYSGLMAASLGWALVWKSGWAVVFCVFVAIFFDRKAAGEERWLRERFPEYADYAARVRKFLPGIY